jgi:hypothetical protein
LRQNTSENFARYAEGKLILWQQISCEVSRCDDGKRNQTEDPVEAARRQKSPGVEDAQKVKEDTMSKPLPAQ